MPEPMPEPVPEPQSTHGFALHEVGGNVAVEPGTHPELAAIDEEEEQLEERHTTVDAPSIKADAIIETDIIETDIIETDTAVEADAITESEVIEMDLDDPEQLDNQ